MFAATQFAHKCVLVTGASRGIGAAVLEAFAKLGATVIGTATSQKGVETIDEQLLTLKARGKGIVLDLATQEGRKEIASQMEWVCGVFGTPTIVVNNAGMTRDNLMLRMKEEEWDAVLGANLSGVFSVTKWCLKGMLKAKWGRIIQLSSVVATMGNPGQANYCAAKAGLLGFTKSLAKEIGSRGITVNAVAPGFIETEMTTKLPKEQQESLLSAIPSGRFGNVAEVASLVLFLASEEAGYIQGQTVHINGGMWMA